MDDTTGFLESEDRRRIAYAIRGHGTPLVRTGTWATYIGKDDGVWGHWWNALSSHRMLVRYDLQGSGLSDWSSVNPTVESRVRDLEVLVDHLRLPTFDLIGQSHGAGTAIEYAVRHPQRVSRLVLVGGFARGTQRRGVQLEERDARMVLMTKGWEDEVSPHRQMFAARIHPDAPGPLDNLLRTRITGANAAEIRRVHGSLDLVDRLPLVIAPTLVFHSAGDISLPVRESQIIPELIPKARLVELASRNHILTGEEPAWTEFLDVFSRFMDSGAFDDVDETTAHGAERGLTRRELEVLRQISLGKSAKEIAAELGVSVRTIGSHVRSLLGKSGSASRAQATAWGARAGII